MKKIPGKRDPALPPPCEVGKVSLPSPMLLSPESTLRRNTSSLHSRGGPSPTRELLSLLPPGGNHLVRGSEGSGLAALGHHLPASRDPTSTASGTGVGVGGKHHSCPSRNHRSFWNLSGNADLPRPCLLAWKTCPETGYTLSGATPCLCGPAFTTQLCGGCRKMRSEGQGGKKGKERERGGDICARVHKYLIS